MTSTPNHLVWDLAFLASGVVLIAVGLTLIRAGREDALGRGAAAA